MKWPHIQVNYTISLTFNDFNLMDWYLNDSECQTTTTWLLSVKFGFIMPFHFSQYLFDQPLISQHCYQVSVCVKGISALLFFLNKHWQDDCSLQSNGNIKNEMPYPAWHIRVSQDIMLSDELDDRITVAIVILDTVGSTSCANKVAT